MGNCSSKNANDSNAHAPATHDVKKVPTAAKNAPIKKETKVEKIENKAESADSADRWADNPLGDPSEGIDSKTMMAISKIQRQARRKRALSVARAEQQWKMFADLDTQDEAEMLHLAVFMQTLIDTVNTFQDKHDETEGSELQSEDVEGDEDFKVVRLESVEYTNRVSKTISVDPNLYDIPGNKIDPSVAFNIIQVYRNGGKLDRKLIVKILRRAYKMLQKQKPVTRVKLPESCKLTVVGDLHGQLTDLFHILDESGLPDKNNRYIFNGDFVDRGERGVEVVVCLISLYVAHGGQVVCLNRGNHEDLPVCRVYGFEAEVKRKYDDLLFEMFCEVFNHLPLFTVANEALFVVHGGLFHSAQVTIDELDEIDRSDYYVKPAIPYPQNIAGLSSEDARKEFMKQLQRDALWSDPTDEVGCYLNPRGAGVSFGPDIAAQFMELNGLSMVIRSHECVYHGFDLPYAVEELSRNSHKHQKFASPPGLPLLCTLFSASNYTGGDNEGAFMEFYTHPSQDAIPAGKSGLYYVVKQYKTSNTDIDDVAQNNKTSLMELILKRKPALLSAFEAADAQSAGVVSRVEWADIMQRVTQIKIRWLSIIQSIAPKDCLSPTSVAYRVFLDSFSVANKMEGAQSPGADAGAVDQQHIGVMDDMYGQRRKLETVFYFFDLNGDGIITLDEFREGCAMLNKSLHPDYQLTDIDKTLKMMDFDDSGTIDINEFFETFRILDSKDGSVDGVIGLAGDRPKNMAKMVKSNTPKAKATLNVDLD